MESAMRNAMSIDVEDYFQVSAMAPYIARSDWDTLECRIERNMQRILQMLDQHQIKATFFTLGWLAKRYPEMIRQIVANGHELASHGYGHQRVTDLSAVQFHQDVSQAKAILEDISGVEVIGYRAPSFSIGATNLWALETLQQTGHRYSSSIYPVQHDHYGMPDAPRFAYRPQGEGGILEIPPTTVRYGGRNWPASGGGYFRLLPYVISKGLLSRVNQLEGQPGVFYFHPWEIDPQQPRQPGMAAKSRFRHYVNLHKMEAKIRALLQDFQWGRMDQVFLYPAASQEVA